MSYIPWRPKGCGPRIRDDLQITMEHNCVTEFSSYSYTYEWKISNINCRLDESSPLQCPEKIRSPPGKIPFTEWQLQALGYKGNSTNPSQPPDSWIVQLTLTSLSSVWARVQLNTKVRSSFSSTSDSEKYSARSLCVSPQCTAPHSTRIFPRGNNNKFTGYIPFAVCGGENIHSSYLYDKDLILSFDITITHLESPIHATRSAAEAETDLGLPCFDLSMVMDDARRRDRYTDIVVVTKEKEFKAHKVVLACQSTFFETCLEERWKKEDDGNRIEMLDVPADIMEAILTYMYTGKVTDIDNTAHDLLPKANEYHLEGLKSKCEEALIKILTSETAIDILLMADMHNAQKLKESCMLFIVKNITDVKKSSAWMEEKLKNTNKDLAMEVLEHIVKSL